MRTAAYAGPGGSCAGHDEGGVDSRDRPGARSLWGASESVDARSVFPPAGCAALQAKTRKMTSLSSSGQTDDLPSRGTVSSNSAPPLAAFRADSVPP